MDLIGLASKTAEAVVNIYAGREGFATRGKEREGRVFYETGIDMALSVLGEAQLSADPHAIILAEYTFISQEYQICPKTDKHSMRSLMRARQGFDDAFLALQVVENSAGYKEADKTHPHFHTYRVSGFPKDSFHDVAERVSVQFLTVYRIVDGNTHGA